MTDLTIISVSSPVYANTSNTLIDCMVEFSNGQTWPYTAAAHDPEPYGATLWANLIAGDYGTIAPYVAPTPTPAQLGYAAIAAGINFTSTGTPSLNGNYSCDPITQAKVNGITTCILVNGTFPNGAAAQTWFDSAGNAHSFPNITAFKNFATAFVNFVTPIDEYINSNGELGSIPSPNITIA